MKRTFLPFSLAAAVSSLAFASPLEAAQRQVTPEVARVLGYLNVTGPEYGAVPNDGQDDTQAIQKAVSEALPGGPRGASVVYLPDGVYDVSEAIRGVGARGEWAGTMVVQGQSRERTVLKLKDSAPGYGDKAAPHAVLHAGGWGGSEAAPGKNALGNSFFDLTVDVGKGNAGAIGIRFNVSNWGAIDNVLVRSSDPQGAGLAGIDQTQPWPGPGIVRNVEVQGFDTGVALAWPQASMVYEHLTLRNQRVAGFRLWDNAATIRDLRSFQSTSGVPAVRTTGDKAMLTLLDGDLRGNGDVNAGTSAIENEAGQFYLRGVRARGYRGALRSREQVLVPGRGIDELSSETPKTLFSTSRARSLRLGVRETPRFWNGSIRSWAVVTDYGATPNDGQDDTVAIQKALDSGRPVVAFPTGTYRVSETLRVRGNVRHVFGNAILEPSEENRFGEREQPRAVVRFESPARLVEEVVWERVNLGAFGNLPGAIVFEHASSRGVAVKDTEARGGFLTYRNSLTPEGKKPGALFVENVSGRGGRSNKYRLLVPQQAWMRQVNTEDAPGSGSYIANLGGTLWILGHKAENPNVAVETRAGGRSELLGGFYLTSVPFPRVMPVIINHESTVSAVYTHGALTPGARYPVHIRETRNGVTRELMPNQVTARPSTPATSEAPGSGGGAFMPLYSSSR
jgi:hypothetical protein